MAIPLHAMKMIPLVAPASEGISVGKRGAIRETNPKTGELYKSTNQHRATSRYWKKNGSPESKLVHQKWNNDNKILMNQYKKKSKDSLRSRVINGYGGCCNCCGERMVEFLSLDHVLGGGNQERKTKSCGGRAAYMRAIKENFPSDYQILCMNCNFAKGIHGGCPHKKTVEEFCFRTIGI